MIGLGTVHRGLSIKLIVAFSVCRTLCSATLPLLLVRLSCRQYSYALEKGWIGVAKTTGMAGSELEDLQNVAVRGLSTEMKGIAIEDFPVYSTDCWATWYSRSREYY